jgi:hypothetical protein
MAETRRKFDQDFRDGAVLSRITERDPVLGRPIRTPILPLTVTA